MNIIGHNNFCKKKNLKTFNKTDFYSRMKFVQILSCKKYVLLKGRIHQTGRWEENGRKQRGRNRKLQEGGRDD